MRFSIRSVTASIVAVLIGRFSQAFLQAGHDLGAVERFAPAVFFHDGRHGFFDPFIGGIAALAGQAFAAAADDFAFLGHPRIDDFVLNIVAEGTLHLAIVLVKRETYRRHERWENGCTMLSPAARTSASGPVDPADAEHAIDQVDDFPHVCFPHAAGRDNGTADPDTAGDSRGLFVIGTAFLLTIMPAASRAASASLPVIPLLVRLTSIKWVSVPPDTIL